MVSFPPPMRRPPGSLPGENRSGEGADGNGAFAYQNTELVTPPSKTKRGLIETDESTVERRHVPLCHPSISRPTKVNSTEPLLVRPRSLKWQPAMRRRVWVKTSEALSTILPLRSSSFPQSPGNRRYVPPDTYGPAEESACQQTIVRDHPRCSNGAPTRFDKHERGKKKKRGVSGAAIRRCPSDAQRIGPRDRHRPR